MMKGDDKGKDCGCFCMIGQAELSGGWQGCNWYAGVNAPCGLVYVSYFASSWASTLNQIEHKLQRVLGHIGATGYTKNVEDIEIVSELVEDIQDIVIKYQVSDDLETFLQVPYQVTGLGSAPTDCI